jgi:hypothetical protein
VTDGRAVDPHAGTDRTVQVVGVVDYCEDSVFMGQKQVRIGMVDEGLSFDGIVD